MSNEPESDRAMVMNLESFGVDGVGYDETETEPPTTNRKARLSLDNSLFFIIPKQ
jgi:hypothetical protein